MAKHFNTDGPIVSTLDEHRAKKLLRAYGIPVIDETVVSTETDSAGEQAVEAARAFGYPVVVKGLGARLLHKTERGLVCLNIHDHAALRGAVAQIQQNAGEDLEGVLIQPQVSGQRELMAGLFQDPQFGPVVLFGIGGVLTEAIADVVLGIAPLSREDAMDMIDRIRARRLLEAFRGESAVDRNILADILLGISALAADHPEIAEVDINPLRVDADGKPWAVDALVVPRDRAVETTPAHVVPQKAIRNLFYPRSIAFIGASAKLGKWGHILVANTVSGGYKGTIFLVNHKGGTIMGRPVYKQVTDIPDPVDLAVVTVPANKVLDLIEPLRAKGVTSVVLITSGFRETGSEGAALEKQLVEAARRAGIMILGPNTMGIINPHIDLYCTGATVKPSAGTTAMVSQSGNMGTQLLAFAEQQGIGIRGFCGSGNEAMITIEDYIEGFEHDDLTRVVILYVESIKNGRRFITAAQRISGNKPIVLLKGGQSAAGSKAAAGHSGAMASDIRVFNAVCRQSGIIKVDDPMDLLDLAAALGSLPLPKGPRVAVMTWGGGWGVVTADLCQSHGLEVPALDPSIIETLDALLPPYWSRANPVDLVGEQDLNLPLTTLEALMKWDGCDAVINLGIMGRTRVVQRVQNTVSKADPGMSSELMDAYHKMAVAFEENLIARSVALMAQYQKPVIGVSIYTGSEGQTVYRLPDAHYNAIFYKTPERAVNALSKMVAYQRHHHMRATS